MKIRWCKNCLLPDSRPNLSIGDDGICDACKSSFNKENIDWEQREKELEELLNKYKDENNLGYDCIIPVSGGKDSTWQVHTILKYGLKPLALTSKCAYRTELGKRNLENLIDLGVDHIDYALNPKVERKIMLKTLRDSGSPSLIEHMSGWGIVLKTAVKFNIPLVIWGENSATEYGGNSKDKDLPTMTLDWIKQYGATNNTVIQDWIDDELTEKELYGYTLPTQEELERAKITPIFLGHYINWDPRTVADISKKVGFEWAPKPILGAWEFADLDCDFIVVHHFLKWFKFGFTRMFDNLSIDIRNGRITRDEAIEFLNNNPQEIPVKQIHNLCQYLNINEYEFWEMMEKFRNHDIWKKDEAGKWYIPNFLEGADFNQIFKYNYPSEK
jgi:N-acetyl sugar amidotransferase